MPFFQFSLRSSLAVAGGDCSSAVTLDLTLTRPLELVPPARAGTSRQLPRRCALRWVCGRSPAVRCTFVHSGIISSTSGSSSGYNMQTFCLVACADLQLQPQLHILRSTQVKMKTLFQNVCFLCQLQFSS